jgi:photosystem II stability/assembly factor-like uncharacterized protein/sugar lactone lactonase YvrE
MYIPGKELSSSVRRVFRCLKHAAWLNLLAALASCGVLSAAIMPAYEHLAPVTETVNGPVALAFDRDGRLYVAETAAGRIAVFSRSGRYLAGLGGLDSPISVAVDANGRVLVGSRDTGKVQVLTGDLAPLFELGAGEGEFFRPSDICLDSAGRVYVVDRGNDIVMLYDSSGQFSGTLGSSGNEAGQLYRPVAIAVNEAAGEIIVLDRQLVAGTEKQGARIQFFSMTGEYLRGFSMNADQEGGMVTPQAIAVDSLGRIYVSDSYQNAVLVYDGTGVFLGAVYDPANPLRTPLGLAMDRGGRLHVASRMADSIEVFGIDSYTDMAIDPALLEFSAREGGDPPAARTLILRNSGKTGINWSAAADAGWISLSAVAGMLGEGQAASIDATVDPTALAPGTYAADITLSAGPGAVDFVPVRLAVAPSPGLAVTPAELSLDSEAGSPPAPAVLSIANTGGAPLDWRASTDAAWLQLDNTSGLLADSSSGPASVTVIPDVTALGPGSYLGTVTFTGLDAHNSPTAVSVTLTLVEPGGPLEQDDQAASSDRQFGNISRAQRKTVRDASLHGVWSTSPSDVYIVGRRGTILHFNGTDWQNIPPPSRRTLYSIWGSDADNIFAVGQRGTIVHYDGSAWTLMPSSTHKSLYAVRGTSASDVYAVGSGGTILHYDGSQWRRMTSPNRRHLYGVWGSAETGFFAVGHRGTILHYNGTAWQEMQAPTANHLYDVWGVPATGNIYAVGRNGIILHYPGSTAGWEQQPSGTGDHLYSVWGASDTDIYAAGRHGTVLRLEGGGWTPLTDPGNETIYSIYGNPGSGMYGVGRRGTILYSE